MKKHTRARVGSILLVVAMLLTLLPVTALAEGDVAEINGTGYKTLAGAIDQVPTDGTATTIKLLQNCTASSFEIPSGTNITLDLNGFTLDLGSGRYGVQLNTDSTFTLTDSGSGGVLKFCTQKSKGAAIYSDGSSQTINIQGGTVEMTSSNTNAFYAVRATGPINISGGTLKASKLDSKFAKPIAIGVNGTSLNITGGTIIAERMDGGTGDGAIGIEFTAACTADIANSVQFNCTMHDIDVQKQIKVTGGTFTNVKFSETDASGSTLENCTINGTLTLGSNECTFTDVQFGEDAVLDSTRYILSEGSVLPSGAPKITFATNNAAMGQIKIDNYNFSKPNSSGGSSDPMETKTWYVNSGSTATVTATAVPADENHKFVGWYPNADGSGTQYSAATQVTFTSESVTENVSYYAVFKETDEYADMKTAATEWANETSPTISSKEQMRYFAFAVNELGKDFSDKTVTLADDLTYTDADSFTPIGTETTPFKGTFGGNGNTITGLSYTGTKGSGYIGLFGYVDGATIQNLTLTGVNFDGGYMTGGFAGEANGSSFTNCVITDSSLSNGYFLGGIFGHSSRTCTVDGCRVEDVTFNGYWKTGGVTGYADGVTISDTTVTDSSIKNSAMSGALVGHANSGATAITDVAVSGVKDENGEKMLAIGTTYEGGNSQTITVSGDNTNIDAAGLVPSDSTSTVQVSGGDFTFTIPDKYIPTTGGEEKISVTFKSDDEIVIVQVIKPNGTVTLPTAPSKDGYTFQGWYLDNGAQVTAETTFAESTTVTAKWSKNPTGGGVITYTATVESVSNGTVTVSPKNASKGSTVTITVTPDDGYVLDALTVKDASGNTITVTESSGKHTFKMPGSAVTVSATFKAESSSLPFTDVDTGDWFYEAVKYAYENGMMNGVGNNLFAPTSNLTRGMICQVLYNLEGTPAASNGVFTDVAADQWYADAVNWTAANDIVGGYGNGKFGPEDDITREQMAQILYNYAAFKGYDVSAQGDLSTFNDGARISDWALSAMKWAVGSGLLQGYNGSLNPTGTATRAEVAQILMNFCENIAK